MYRASRVDEVAAGRQNMFDIGCESWENFHSKLEKDPGGRSSLSLTLSLSLSLTPTLALSVHSCVRECVCMCGRVKFSHTSESFYLEAKKERKSAALWWLQRSRNFQLHSNLFQKVSSLCFNSEKSFYILTFAEKKCNKVETCCGWIIEQTNSQLNIFLW